MLQSTVSESSPHPLHPGMTTTLRALCFSCNPRMFLVRHLDTPSFAPACKMRASPAMMASVAAHDPWVNSEEASWDGHHPPQYVAWHIRTSEGESATSFNKNVHNYVFHQERSTTVVPLYLAATNSARRLCPRAFQGLEGDLPVYISSNRRVVFYHAQLS